ncbi:TetR/AcrR family transcriptional regulator [Actinacidiphila glaucinigra]|uniref:TetR/AcrR family transcriptional regulator n=1 Tax=Actinacidiphila glaucinigra TaxID=235986 RepID=UPI0035DC9DFB
MSRWQPGSRARLQTAALDLFLEGGYSATTTAAIAERAGVTDRTFYRHFKDKSEVLFGDEARLEQLLVGTFDASADSTANALRTSLRALAQDFQPRRADILRRAIVIESVPDLAERELLKLRSWSHALTRLAVTRDGDDLAARAQVEVAMALFRAAFRSWTHDDDPPSLDELIAHAYTAVGHPGFSTRRGSTPSASTGSPWK